MVPFKHVFEDGDGDADVYNGPFHAVEGACCSHDERRKVTEDDMPHTACAGTAYPPPINFCRVIVSWAAREGCRC